MDVYLEVGGKRAFAAAIDWSGWARSGRDEEAALTALTDYGERYKKAMGTAARELKRPVTAGDLRVVERLDGNATTDFGAPGVIPKADERPADDDDLTRLLSLLHAARAAFERAATAADGEQLEPAGPRGGGRSLAKIRAHVAEAEVGYLQALGGKVKAGADRSVVQESFGQAARARARGELPDQGPRGGKRWPARFAIRRSAWHALDHAWEIEDRRPG